MENKQDPKDKVLINQSIEIVNLKVTVEQLKDELTKAITQKLEAQEILKQSLQGGEPNED